MIIKKIAPLFFLFFCFFINKKAISFGGSNSTYQEIQNEAEEQIDEQIEEGQSTFYNLFVPSANIFSHGNQTPSDLAKKARLRKLVYCVITCAIIGWIIGKSLRSSQTGVPKPNIKLNYGIQDSVEQEDIANNAKIILHKPCKKHISSKASYLSALNATPDDHGPAVRDKRAKRCPFCNPDTPEEPAHGTLLIKGEGEAAEHFFIPN